MANGFLLNTVPGGTVISSTAEFDVRNYAKRLVLAGAIDGDVVQVQILAGYNDTVGTWTDLVYNGTSIQLTDQNTQYEIIVEGRYRVIYNGGSTALQVWMEEDTIGLDQRTISAFLAPSVIKGIGATGPKGDTGATGPAGPSNGNPGFGPVANGDNTLLIPTGPVSVAVNTQSSTIATYTLRIQDGTKGQVVFYNSIGAVTTLTLGGTNFTTQGLAQPTTWPAGFIFGWVYDDGTDGGTVGWMRFQ